MTILQNTPAGLYCPAGDFYIDPLKPVTRAVVTHAHTDHARWGCKRYLASKSSEHLLRMRLGADALIRTLPFGETQEIGGVRVRFHPAGHMLGSAQGEVQHQGEIAVVSGDYKLGSDPTCDAWQPVRCNLFVTESTFALPVYRWLPHEEVFDQINRWWREAKSEGKCCLLYGYAVGKSQRLIAGLDASLGPIYTHGAVEKGTQAYRDSGVPMPTTIPVSSMPSKHDWRGSMVVAVPSAHGTPWMRKFGSVTTAMASGWMQIRGNRRRRGFDRGFVLSDHVDWPEFLNAIKLCEAEQVWVTHGYSEIASRYLREQGWNASAIQTRQPDEEDSQEHDPSATVPRENGVLLCVDRNHAFAFNEANPLF
ncbi:MAG: ligase-associated DNA damage response exonuclease [Pirellulaceae bacterium]